MFVGREKELRLLDEELKKDSSAILVYGKRKVGKSTLIKKACENHPEKMAIYYECTKDTEENNVLAILSLLKHLGLASEYIGFEKNDFIHLFTYLDSLEKKLIVVIDEYPYLKELNKASTIDSNFQSIIDNHCKNIDLFISGSHIAMMKDLLMEKNALFGRFARVIFLNELSYLEASAFYPNLTPYEKVAFYAVFGGSPFVNEQINPKQSLKDNILRLLLDNTSSVYNHAAFALVSDLSNSIHANRVFAALGNGRKSYSELEEILDKNKTGLLSKFLKPLLEMEMLKKVAPINKLNDAKKAKYEINDNLLRFYYAYVLPQQNLLNYKSLDAIYEEDIEPSLITFISLRFEDMCRDFMWRWVNANRIPGVINIGRYYYDDPVEKKNGEFDLAILNKDQSVQLFEIKYLSGKVTQAMVDKELWQIKQIENLKVDKVGFISINGFEREISGLNYQIEGKDLYLP